MSARHYLPPILRPGMYAGPQGDRSLYEWQADAVAAYPAPDRPAIVPEPRELFTSRSTYWHIPGVGYRATQGPGSPPSAGAYGWDDGGSGGHVRLDSLMRLKGEPDVKIRFHCNADGSHKESKR